MALSGIDLARLGARRASVGREFQLLREAIAMVAAGRSRRVVLAGIRHGELLLEPAIELAREAGVGLTPLERSDRRGLDLSIERHRV